MCEKRPSIDDFINDDCCSLHCQHCPGAAPKRQLHSEEVGNLQWRWIHELCNCQAVVIVGQSSPPGVSSSTNYTLYSGYLQPIFGGVPGSALVWIWTDSINVYLDWEDIPYANTYYIYRSTDPAFVPGPTNLIGSATISQYTDNGVVTDLEARNFYKIVCSD